MAADEHKQPDCRRCDSSGWVCENHDYIPWKGGDADCCGGAGAPCKDCNNVPNVMPRMEAGSRVMWIAANGWARAIASLSRSKILALLTDMENRLGRVKNETAALHHRINKILEDDKE